MESGFFHVRQGSEQQSSSEMGSGMEELRAHLRPGSAAFQGLPRSGVLGFGIRYPVSLTVTLLV